MATNGYGILLAITNLLASFFGSLPNGAVNGRERPQPLDIINASSSMFHFTKFYLFSVTNVESVLRGEKPFFEEKGPYVFRQERNKEFITWSEDKTLVSYNAKNIFHFEPNMSNGSLEDVVVIPNLPLLGFSAMIMRKATRSWFQRRATKITMDNLVSNLDDKVFVNYTVGEFLFHGKKSDFLANIKEVMDAANVPLHGVPQDGKFSLNYGRNNSADGRLTVDTGKLEPNDFGKIVKWNNRNTVSCWKSERCNRIDGTDGTVFHSSVSKEDSLRVFIPELRRSLGFKYEMDEIVRGSNVYKFVVPEEELSAPRYNELNSCYCNAEEYDDIVDICAYKGIIDISECMGGNPLLISLPHFYSSNQTLIDKTVGMAPSKEKHESFVKIEPDSGKVVTFVKRLQLNYYIREGLNGDNSLKMLENVTKGIYPYVWIEETSSD